MATTYMGGKADVSLNGVTIPAQYLSSDGVTTTLTEGTREVPTLAGTFKQPSGTYDDTMVVFNVTLPNMNYLKNILPDMYTASVDRPTVAGQTAFGGDECMLRENTPLVVHYTCEPNSDNDIFVPNGSVQASVEIVQNVDDPVTVEITVNAQPSDDHDGKIVIIGTGSLTEPTLWNAETEEYEAISS
jgi:hypothetical protein